MIKPKFVDILEKVDDAIFIPALEEIKDIDWDYVRTVDIRHTNSAFVDCTTLALRITKGFVMPSSNSDADIRKVADIIEAVDMKCINDYPRLQEIIKWSYSFVNGLNLGRVMLVKMNGFGRIPLHIDPGKYFEVYKRFHIVFKTDPDVLFVGPPNSEPTHMPYGYLCQLNNIDLHGVVSKSNESRIHLIVDIETQDRRFEVSGPSNV